MKNLLVLFLLASTSAIAQNTVELSVHFDKGSDVPFMPEMAMLNEIAEHPNSSELRFSVVGHTDATGSEEFNRMLSKDRTRTVVNHLLLSGIKPYNIIFEYHGETCFDEEGDEAAQAENRRVDIHISNVGELDAAGFAGLYSEETFQRPLPKIDPDAELFLIRADESNCIETASGTLIDIPAMAFMDAYGRRISGNVEIAYEEFNDPFSIFLSGITMKYNDDGTEMNLESAGMFSLTASQRNKPVELRPDRPVSLDFVSTSIDSDFDFFFLDPAEESWTNIGAADLRDDDAELVYSAESMSPAVASYLQQTDFLSPAFALRSTLEDHFYNMQYMNNRPIASYYRFLRTGDQKEKRQFRREWKRKANYKITLKSQKLGSEHQVSHFTISNQWLTSHNAELRRFQGHVWEYDGPLTRKQLKKGLQKKRFHDMRIRFNQETDQVVLELKDLDGITEIPVKKGAIENASAEYQKRMWGEFSDTYQKIRLNSLDKAFEAKYQYYLRSLVRQEKNLVRDANRFDRKSQREYQRDLKMAWKTSRNEMHEDEKLMSFPIWATNCNQLSEKLGEYYERQQQGTSVIRSLTLNRMGIYNCDRIYQMQNPQKVEPRFVLADGKAIYWKTAYVFDEDINGVLTFEGGGESQITLDPSALMAIVVLDYSGRTYRINETEVIAMNRGKKAQRIMHITEFDDSVASLEEMREMLGFATE